MITAIYLAHNRLDFVKETFLPFVKECKSDLVTKVIIYDDASTDGTSDFIMTHYYNLPIKFQYKRMQIGSSWKQLNMTYPIADKYILKVDNDILIPDGYINALFNVLEARDDIGFSGIRTGAELLKPDENDITEVRHIGGVGLFRTDEFKKLGGIKKSILPQEERFYGFTAMQERSKLKKIWIGGVVKDLSFVLREKQKEYMMEGYTRRNIQWGNDYQS